jgi:predicted HTH domain antitoxin
MAVVAQVRIPESITLSLREPTEKIGLEMKRALAVIYYSDRKLSLGQCCELAEMGKADFIKYLSRYKTSIFNFDSDDELMEDIRNA